MTIINHLPIINLVLFLTTGVFVALFKRKKIDQVMSVAFITLVTTIILSVIILVHVNTVGPIHYFFGNHARHLGIEFYVDPLAAFFTLFIVILATLIYVYSSGDATEGIEEREFGRYYILLFILLFSMYGILYTNDLFNTFVFMEILSITTCSIISIKRKKDTYTSAFRYVMLNEIGSLSYLFGVALLYMITGYTNMTLISEAISGTWELYTFNIIIAIAFMIIGIGIKSAIFPFHIWLPDAHASAPSTSSAILSAIVVKVYVLVFIKILLRVFGLDILLFYDIPLILTIIGATGMIMGSVFAIAQKDVKRMLGYSSVAQIGYIVLGLGLMSEEGMRGAFFHIISHGLMKSALFLSVGIIITFKHIRKISDFNGLGYQMPVTMGVFSIAALGMIGIPLTTGFVSKFYLGTAVLSANQGIFLIVLIVSGLLNVVYYLPIIIAAFLRDNKENQRFVTFDRASKSMVFVVAILGVLILTLGMFPHLIMPYIDKAIYYLFI